MKKKLLVLVLASAMIVSLPACGNANETCPVERYWEEGQTTVIEVVMPDGSIHTYEEPWIAHEIIREISFCTNGTDSYEEWEVIPPSFAIE